MGWSDVDGVGVLAVAKGPEPFRGDDKEAAEGYQGGQEKLSRPVCVCSNASALSGKIFRIGAAKLG